VNVDNVTVSTAGFAQSAAPSALPLLTQQVTSASVGDSNASGVFVANAIVRAGARAVRPGVHADLTDQAYDSEVSAYFRDDSLPPPAPFYYGPSPPGATSPFASVHSRADSRQSRTSYRSVSRQPRAPSRQSVMSVRSHASGRQSTHSQAPDPVIELMNKMFDKVAGDAAVQRAHADRREQQMQATMEKEIERKERETRLQLENELLKEKVAAAEKRQAAVQSFSPPPAAVQFDVHADSATSAAAGAPQSVLVDVPTPASFDSPARPPASASTLTSADSRAPLPPLTAGIVTCPIAGTLVQLTAAARDVHSLVLPAPAPADTQYTALPSLTDYTLPATMPDMTFAAGPPRVLSRTIALTTYSSMYTVGIDRALPAAYDVYIDRTLPTVYDVNIDRALLTMGSSQFSMMDGRCDLSVPLYTTPSVVPTVTSVVPAVHTSSLFSSGAYAQAPGGAFITHTSHGPVVSFPLDAYPG